MAEYHYIEADTKLAGVLAMAPETVRRLDPDDWK